MKKKILFITATRADFSKLKSLIQILKDLDIEPSDVEKEMKKWLWRYKDGGQFAKA